MPIREIFCERLLNFTGHCICMPTNEPFNCFVICKSKERSSLRQGMPARQQISYQPLLGDKALEAIEIRKMAVHKSSRASCIDESTYRKSKSFKTWFVKVFCWLCKFCDCKMITSLLRLINYTVCQYNNYLD